MAPVAGFIHDASADFPALTAVMDTLTVPFESKYSTAQVRSEERAATFSPTSPIRIDRSGTRVHQSSISKKSRKIFIWRAG
jgi:hypothetical protein